jgi:hypothetical protein
MSKFILALKFLLKLLLHFVPTTVIAEYITEEKRVKKLAERFKAILNNNPTLGRVKIDDYIVDKMVEAWTHLGRCLRDPDSKELKWLNEKTKELEKLAD